MTHHIQIMDYAIKPDTIPDTNALLIKRIKELEATVVELALENKKFKLKQQNKVLFSDFLLQWLEHHKTKVEPTTWDGYNLVMQKHIQPYFIEKQIYLQDLKPIDLQKYYDFKIAAGLSVVTVLKHHANIHAALRYACKMQLLQYNVADFIDLPPKLKFMAEYYTIDEMVDLLKLAKDTTIYPAIVLAGVLGLRRSEALGLKWSSIDFENRTIRIERKAVPFITRKDVLIEKKLKTNSSHRTLPLPDCIFKYLVRLRDQHIQNYGKSTYVCLNSKGTLFKPNSLSQGFKKFIRDNDLRPIRYHDLRHTCASMLYTLGCSLKDIQMWLGHSDITTTSNLYVHLGFKDKQPMAQLIAKALSKIL